MPSESTPSWSRSPKQNCAPVSAAFLSGQANTCSCSKNRSLPSTRLRLRVRGSISGSTPVFSSKKRRISPLRSAAPPSFHRRSAQWTPCSRRRLHTDQTDFRYASMESPTPLPSKAWRDTLSLCSTAAWAVSTALRCSSRVPLVVIQTRNPFCPAIFRISPNSGCDSGSPIRCR